MMQDFLQISVTEFKQLPEEEQKEILEKTKTMVEHGEDLIKQHRRIQEQYRRLSGKHIKFILIITPEIDRYLEWSSIERRMHKSQVVRAAIEKVIKRDGEYQDCIRDGIINKF